MANIIRVMRLGLPTTPKGLPTTPTLLVVLVCAGAALLGGCGGGTKTVSIASTPPAQTTGTTTTSGGDRGPDTGPPGATPAEAGPTGLGLVDLGPEDLGEDAGGPGAGPADLVSRWMATMGPILTSLQLGSAVGHLARATFGQYELPIPRPSSTSLLVVPANVEAFARDWSLPGDEVRPRRRTKRAARGVVERRARRAWHRRVGRTAAS